jgi:hypothetical protein
MAEPGDRGVVPMRVTREFSVSRVEKQLLVKLYCLLVPVVQGHCQSPPLRAERARSRRLIRNALSTKGV